MGNAAFTRLRLFPTLCRRFSLRFDPRLRSVLPTHVRQNLPHFRSRERRVHTRPKGHVLYGRGTASRERKGVGRLERFPALLSHRPSPETPLRPRPRSVSKSSRLPTSESEGERLRQILRRVRPDRRPPPYSLILVLRVRQRTGWRIRAFGSLPVYSLPPSAAFTRDGVSSFYQTQRVKKESPPILILVLDPQRPIIFS